MLRTILTGVALLSLSFHAAAEPAKDERAASEDSQGTGDRPADPRYEYDPHARGPYYGALVPPPPETLGKDYPVCSDTVKDGCLNPNQLKRKREEEEAQRAKAETGKGDGEGGD